MSTDPAQSLVDTIRADLQEALRRRDRATVASLREILAAVDNASAVDAPQGYDDTGRAPTEVPRREVAFGEVVSTLHRLVDQRLAAAARGMRQQLRRWASRRYEPEDRGPDTTGVGGSEARGAHSAPASESPA